MIQQATQKVLSLCAESIEAANMNKLLLLRLLPLYSSDNIANVVWKYFLLNCVYLFAKNFVCYVFASDICKKLLINEGHEWNIVLHVKTLNTKTLSGYLRETVALIKADQRFNVSFLLLKRHVFIHINTRVRQFNLLAHDPTVPLLR